VRRTPQRGSILTVVSAISALPFQLLRHQRNVCHQGGSFRGKQKRQTLPNEKKEAFLYEYPLQRVLLLTNPTRERCSSVAYFSSTVAIFTTESSL
jgi:hypothetical protein